MTTTTNRLAPAARRGNLHPSWPAGLLVGWLLWGLAGALLAAAPKAAPGPGIQAPPAGEILKTLRREHPRLILLPADLERIRQYAEGNADARKYLAAVREAGERMLGQPPVERVLIGPRLLDKSRQVVNRMHTLGLLYRLDGERKWLDRAVRELRAVAAFTDWNPSHFLDVAEMTHGFAIAYDWFYPGLAEADRALVKQALVDRGLREAEKIYRRNGSWVVSAFNWNNVCNGGILSGALAVADEEPELAGYLAAAAVRSLPRALASYAPDGAWAEGPGYWGYATRYTVVALASLQSALGTDFGLGDLPGMAEAGVFRIYGAGPAGQFFNFADAGENSGAEPSLFWLARRYQNPAYAAAARRAAGARPSALDLAYFDPQGGAADLQRLPLDRHFRAADIVFFRSDWLTKEAFYAGFKAGDNQANHSNLDLGTFILDAQGERWAIELGADDYNLPGYFGKQRWNYYRLRTEGQNCLLLEGGNQDPKAAASIVAFQGGAERAFAVADLTAGYAPAGAVRVWRGLAALDQHRRLLVQDEIATQKPVAVEWGMHTRAAVEVQGRRAILTQRGRRLRAEILAPPEALFTCAPVTPPPPQKPAPGVSKLLVRLPEKTAQTRLAILLSPEPESAAAGPVVLQPLGEWK
jgi:hypothetical protein